MKPILLSLVLAGPLAATDRPAPLCLALGTCCCTLADGTQCCGRAGNCASGVVPGCNCAGNG
ncbi:MAG: hypothetical protein AAF390_15550 [Pseudomonadota bacterium]